MSEGGTDGVDGSLAVHYEEVLAMRDEEGAGGLTGRLRIFVVVFTVVTLVAAGFVVWGWVDGALASVGGAGAVWESFGDLAAGNPLFLLGFAIAALVIIVFTVLSIRGLSGAFDRELNKQVRVRVTDAGVTIERSGSRNWESAGEAVPFDSITAVEYVDPEESSFRVELGDVRAPKFIAGRSRDWVRIERADAAAVYVGSDSPRELAAAIAERVPGGVTPTPY